MDRLYVNSGELFNAAVQLSAQAVISILFGAMSIIAALVFFIKRDRPNHARTIMALAIAGGMMGLLL